VIRQAQESGYGQADVQHSSGKTHSADQCARGLRHEDAVAVEGPELRDPAPETADVHLLNDVHGSGMDDPRPDRRFT
jgi:hypothetical protein